MQFLVARKHVLSDGKLDYTREVAPKHNTTCDIKTTELYPRIVSTPRPIHPDERKEQDEAVQSKLREES